MDRPGADLRTAGTPFVVVADDPCGGRVPWAMRIACLVPSVVFLLGVALVLRSCTVLHVGIKRDRERAELHAETLGEYPTTVMNMRILDGATEPCLARSNRIMRVTITKSTSLPFALAGTTFTPSG